MSTDQNRVRAGAALLAARATDVAATFVTAMALTTPATAIAAAATATAAAADAAAATTVTIDTGEVEGATQDNIISFKGIPFAQPPVGELRWKAPQAPTKWSGVRKATSYGADCMQVPFPSDAAPLGMQPA
jgi:para-nitrobenzyl esterase